MRLLDIVLCNIYCCVDRCEDALLAEGLHHPALVVSVDRLRPKPESKLDKVLPNAFNFRRANISLLYEQLLFTDWSFLASYTDVDQACSQFYDTVNTIFSYCVPKYCASKCHRRFPPWFNGCIIRDIRSKEILFRTLKRNPSEDTLCEYKALRTKIKRDIDIAYKNYIKKCEDDIKRDPTKFWSFINSKRCQGNIPNNMKYNGMEMNYPQNILNSFADYFNKSFTTSSNINSRTAQLNGGNTLTVLNFSNEEVYAALKRLKPKLTSGPDGIPAFILKDCASILAKPLAIIYNLALRNGCFPLLWKVSKVCPVFKNKGVKCEIENYRPITIINNFSKVFETHIYDAIYWHVQNSILPEQHGFVKKRSTVTNLFCTTQFISENIDFRAQLDIIYTDFSKAFDRIDHSILLNNISDFGVTGNLLLLIESYLSERTSDVSCNGYLSDNYKVTSGVPQGSVLGPLFFVIFINDIGDLLDVHFLLYADYMKLLCPIRTIEDCHKLQRNVNILNRWCHKNNMPLNVSKCNVVRFSNKNQTVVYDYDIGGVPLNRLDEIKDLGVLFNSKNCFNSHMEAIIADIYKKLGFVIRCGRELQDVETIKLLYYSFVRSKLEYAAIVWQPCYNFWSDRLENVQRRLLKYLYFKTNGSYPPTGFSQEILEQTFDVKSLRERRDELSVKFVSDI
nr:unnamed protein product [Callosobruchus analis]